MEIESTSSFHVVGPNYDMLLHAAGKVGVKNKAKATYFLQVSSQVRRSFKSHGPGWGKRFSKYHGLGRVSVGSGLPDPTRPKPTREILPDP